MTGGYRLSPTAEAELGEILLYLAGKEGVARALDVHGHFLRTFEVLAEQPGVGRKHAELTGDRFRWWNIFEWILIYDPESSPITVLRVIHGARALDEILRPEGT